MIRRFIVKGTVEERMEAVKARKQLMISGALTDQEVRTARIEELKMLFTQQDLISEAKFHMGCNPVSLEACSTSKKGGPFEAEMKYGCWTWKGDRANISDHFFLKNYLSKSRTELVDLESIYNQGADLLGRFYNTVPLLTSATALLCLLENATKLALAYICALMLELRIMVKPLAFWSECKLSLMLLPLPSSPLKFKSGRVDLALEIYQQMVTKALKADLVLYNTLVNGFCKGGYFRESRKLVGEMTKRATRRVSCTTCFDALWFCYSPVHQVQQYYRLGLFDNCSQKWSDLVDCLTLKTKRSSQVQVSLSLSLSLSLSMTAKLCFIAILKHIYTHKRKGSLAIILITLSIISCPGSIIIGFFFSMYFFFYYL
ncbi:hypothetical protein OIU84_015097 [Salix udensis]|uniref:Pentatricopeptide repeat-containing protein n=1 Tax=Salix udensis TaxID=889485 RepID=A0AAD6NSA5_9ROSI|nr:hypothetical protein OIU84_015097 [Salix udensis]